MAGHKMNAGKLYVIYSLKYNIIVGRGGVEGAGALKLYKHFLSPNSNWDYYISDIIGRLHKYNKLE